VTDETGGGGESGDPDKVLFLDLATFLVDLDLLTRRVMASQWFAKNLKEAAERNAE
jgi:hypothetical protein